MEDSGTIHRRQLGYLLMAALICLVYANSFQASWHFDDFSNIVFNQKLHMNDLSYRSIVEAFHADPRINGKLYRPVACLTFALNWYLGHEAVFGYHVVNIVIHCLASLFLLQALIVLFQTPMLAGRYYASDAPYWIALLAATLWAIHPIQTQAITYIVQRMAALAGMFYIAGLFCFLKGRLHTKRGRALIWYGGVVLAYLLALGTKENAVIFPLALVLMELTLFRPHLFNSNPKRFVLATALTAVILLGVVAVLLISDETMTLLNEGYSHRYFNHSERLLTQFRVLVYYLFQIGYPNTAHLSLDHHFIVSTSLFSPWTTLPAIILIFCILWSSLYFLPKVPLLGFGGLFFLLQHSVESTFLPLELVFEHRNYIPSMFLFTGLAGGLYRLICNYREQSLLLHRFLVVGSALLICFVGIGTYSRNTDWRSEKSLWEDAVKKSPGSGRAYHNLAWGYYERIGDTATAIALYKQAIRKQIHCKDSVGTSFLNIGNIYFRQGNYREAMGQYKESLVRSPYNVNTHLRLVHTYMALADWDQAKAVIETFLPLGKRPGEFYSLMGLVLLNKQQPAKALEWFRKANHVSGGAHWRNIAGIGQSMQLMGQPVRGDFFLRYAQTLVPEELFLILNRLDLYLSTDQSKKAAAMAELFVGHVPAANLAQVWENLISNHSPYPLHYQHIRPLIEEVLQKTLKKFENSEGLMVLTHQ